MDAADGLSTRDEAALDALRWNWGEAYEIGAERGTWWFRRRDGLGGRETADSPDMLRAAIIDNYQLHPVPRKVLRREHS